MNASCVRKIPWGCILHTGKKQTKSRPFTTWGKPLATCLGAVEEILLTSWNEGKTRKEVVFQRKDVCPIPASASC